MEKREVMDWRKSRVKSVKKGEAWMWKKIGMS